MAFFDLPQPELERYTPTLEAPSDFAPFWIDTIGASLKKARKPSFTRTAPYLEGVEAWDVEFSGFNGDPIKAWYLCPAAKLRGRKKVPCVVEYIGYGGGRGYPHSWTLWPSAGFAILVMDTRGQGSVWSQGGTPDPDPVPANPQYPGFMTRGIGRKESYYYRRVFTDAVLAALTASQRTEVDPGRIFLTGGSQGGGITLAAAGLLAMTKPHFPKLPHPAGIMADVPFLCHYERALAITNGYPYQEIVQYLKQHREENQAVLDTLRYFDGIHFAPHITSPSLVSVGLMDDICPPSTVYAAFNRLGSPQKSMEVYPYSGHEGGGPWQESKKLLFAKDIAQGLAGA